MTGQTFAFGSFRLDPNRRALRERCRLLHMGSRALDILIALAENAGEILTRGQLVERVWPSTVVGDASLRVHVAGLREALADGQDGYHGLRNYHAYGLGFDGELACLQGDFVRGMTLMRRPATGAAPGLSLRLSQCTGEAGGGRWRHRWRTGVGRRGAGPRRTE